MSRTKLALALAVAAVLTPLAGSVPASAAPARSSARAVVPALPAGLPAGIEDLATYVQQVSCDPVPKPGALALGRLLTTTYPGTSYLIGQDCGSEPVASEHEDGRAVDWMVSARSATQKAQAQAFLGWLFATDGQGRGYAEARRLGVMYIIWDNMIWGAWDPIHGWSPYSTCATHPEADADAVCHRDRMLVSLSWQGATEHTSFFSRQVAQPDYGPCRPKDLNWAPRYTTPNHTPCPDYPQVLPPSGADALLTALVRFSGATVGSGSSGPVVTAVQQALGIPADGQYGPFTADGVTTFQRQHAVSPSGTMDAATWRQLLAVQELAIFTEGPQPVGTTSPLTKYAGTVLRYGDRNAAVLALQTALNVTHSGWFGPKTRAAVVTLQLRAGLPTTGVVDAATWKALGA